MLTFKQYFSEDEEIAKEIEKKKKEKEKRDAYWYIDSGIKPPSQGYGDYAPNVKEGEVNELSSATLRSYIKKAGFQTRSTISGIKNLRAKRALGMWLANRKLNPKPAEKKRQFKRGQRARQIKEEGTGCSSCGFPRWAHLPSEGGQAYIRCPDSRTATFKG